MYRIFVLLIFAVVWSYSAFDTPSDFTIDAMSTIDRSDLIICDDDDVPGTCIAMFESTSRVMATCTGAAPR